MSQKLENSAEQTKLETATLAGGCFWCTEAVFVELKGVESVVSGYAGGSVSNPSYEDVCTGETGHAESIQIAFDPKIISYADILRVFFGTHDPTTLNRQGADVGTQYRSEIFYHDKMQKDTAEQILKEVNESGIWGKPLVTKIEEFKAFYEAEDYHKNYFEMNPRQPYCQAVIAPKVAKFRKHYFEMLKK